MMRRVLATIAAGAALAACADAPKATATAQAPGPLAPYGWLGELAGSCWTGESPGAATIETQCFLVQYERLIRGSIKVTQPGSPLVVFEGDVVFAFDERRARVVYTQWGTHGQYGTGEVSVEGDTLRLQHKLADGTDAPRRFVWRRQGADAFRVTREMKDGSDWKQTGEVEFRRAR